MKEKNVIPPDNQLLNLQNSLSLAKREMNPVSIRSALDNLIRFHQSKGAFDKCAFYCKDVLTLLQGKGMENELAGKYVFIGNCNLRLSDFPEAEDNYNTALKIYKSTGSYFGCAEVNVNIGRLHREKGQLESSLTYLGEALDIYEKHQSELDREENARSRFSYSGAMEVTGILYSQLRQYDKAHDFLNRNLNYRKKLGDREGIIQAMINLGASYNENNPEKALSCFLEAREVAGQDFHIIPTIALINNIGGCYENMGDYPQALKYYHEALQMAEDGKQTGYRSKILKHIGSVYYRQEQYDLAIDQVLLSLQLSTQENARLDVLSCYGVLCDIYTAKKDFETALDYLRKVSDLKDTLFNEEMVQKLSSLQKKFDETSIRLAEVQKQNSLVTEALKKAINMSFVGVSDSIRRVHELAMTAALHSSTNVLITGESGVGKEIVARLIHYAGQGKNGLFVDVNCSSIPESLAESEFFGYNKGAFTGAAYSKAGFLEEANNGTLFLDEIADTPQLLQAKFLRVLETRQVKRLGSNKAIKVDFRLISATNKDITQMIQHNQFRADLLYRINTLEINIPPLRERKDDIEPLLNHYLTEFARVMKKPVPNYDKSVLNMLLDYNFPGNVRELKNMIEKAMILLQGNTLTPDNFDVCHAVPNDDKPASKLQALQTLENVETQMLLDALKEANGNQTKAAQILGISYSTFKRKYKAIDKPK